MDILSLSSQPKFHPLTHPKLTANSSFNIIQHVKRLTTQKFAVKTSTATTDDETLAQKRRSKQSLHEITFKPLHDFISSFNDLHLPPYLDPKHVLSGSFAPVDELPPTACEVVEGSLPPCLDGAYIQNGPNPQFFPRGPYHLVDGDGMLHSIKISRGKATFCSRFVKTNKYIIENELGYSAYPNIFGSFTSKLTASMVLTVVRILTGPFNPFINGIGTANTSLARIGGHLFALVETDVPYEVKITADGDITTIGRHDFQSGESFQIMTAHPKFDPDTGETFAFRYFFFPPFLTYFRIDSNRRKHKNLPIHSVKGASFVHDFAVTKNFAIFPDTQIVMKFFEIMRGRSMMKVDCGKMPRLGIISRYAEDESEMYWVDAPGLNLLHSVNAWEEDDGDTIVILASNMLSVEHVVEQMDLVNLSMDKIIIDVKAKKVVSRRPVLDKCLDFGVISPKYALKKNRYIYAAVVENIPKMLGVVKIDLSLSMEDGGDCTVACRMYGPGCYGSEPIFVAREPNNPEAEEDDGYLLAYVNNESTRESHFLVMDAKSPNLVIVAAVKLPRRVPQGFHSIFVKESDLLKL